MKFRVKFWFCYILTDETVAFSAYLVSGISNHHNKSVIYNAVETNKGSGYSTSTGLFTVPVDGTYVFIWNSMTFNTGYGYCEIYLYKNGALLDFIIVQADSRGRTGGTDSASNSIVLSLNTGVKVGTRTTTCNYLYGRPHTFFSGFKI